MDRLGFPQLPPCSRLEWSPISACASSSRAQHRTDCAQQWLLLGLRKAIGKSLSTTSASAGRFGNSGAMRNGAWLFFSLAELLAISIAYDKDAATWYNPVFYDRLAAIWALCSAALFALISWPRRDELFAMWRTAQQHHDWRGPFALNLALFCTIIAVTPVVTAESAADVAGFRVGLGIYAILIVAVAVSLLRLNVPLRALFDIARRYRASLAAAMCAGAVVEFISYLAQDSWRMLGGATLQLSRAILWLYERDVAVDVSEYSLSVGRFKVIIAESCSGSEGVGLVVAFLASFLWVFRGSLRFPHAFLLLPVGVACIWVLNGVRIASLVSIGAHVSPQIAQQGFHSQAGWIAFLVVTLGIMVLASRTEFFARVTAVERPARGGRLAAAYLAPFIALMLSSVLLAAAAPQDRPLYPVKIIAVLFVLWIYRDVYRGISWGSLGEPLLAGLIVGGIWIATDPNPGAGAALGTWLDEQSIAWMVVWLSLRVVGSVIIVPIVEELAFRGFLYRWLVARNFDSVPFSHFSVAALVVSSLMFGMLHERWIAAGLSGAVFALVIWRTNSLSGGIVAHATANGLICSWAIGFKQ